METKVSEVKDYIRIEEYQAWVSKGVSPHIDKYTPTVRGLWVTSGLVREASEALEIFEKALRKNQPFDVEKLKDELGDVLWYLTACAELNGLNLEDVLEHNITKLNTRYYKALEELV